tara:strand:- start:3047 stop:3688 length:642 start_codon:yes stop_codon:yes gene_type:complete
MNLFKLVITNIKNYGVSETFILVILEIIYSFNSNYNKHIFFDESISDAYSFSKKNKVYNSPYCPTPIYFLKIISSFLKNFNLKKFTFIDFGSGAGRTLFFFKNYFKNFYGIEFNKTYEKYYKKEEFILCDLRKKNDFKFLKKNNRFFILFFFDPFEQNLVEKIVSKFEDKKYIIILINYRKLGNKYGKKLFNKEFINKNRNIRIYSNFDFKKL